MEKQEYILETSPDGKKWTHRATFREGEPSRFGKPMSAEVVILEANSFIDHWTPQHQGYDANTLREINDRKHVRIIIELQ